MLENLNFQRIVLIIAGVLFLGFMITVIYSMLKANAIGEWPPVIANCPDHLIVERHSTKNRADKLLRELL